MDKPVIEARNLGVHFVRTRRRKLRVRDMFIHGSGRQPAKERLLLYGDLLRAAGREVEARAAYERAAGHEPADSHPNQESRVP